MLKTYLYKLQCEKRGYNGCWEKTFHQVFYYILTFYFVANLQTVPVKNRIGQKRCGIQKNCTDFYDSAIFAISRSFFDFQLTKIFFMGIVFIYCHSPENIKLAIHASARKRSLNVFKLSHYLVKMRLYTVLG